MPFSSEMVRSASSCIQARKFSRPSMRRTGSPSRTATASSRVAPGRMRLLTRSRPRKAPSPAVAAVAARAATSSSPRSESGTPVSRAASPE
ncbi:MAG: hypothetical protein ABSB59_41790 [Streptosporangiaceae bacterium]